MTAGMGRLVNDSHSKGQLVNDGHSKGQLVNDGQSEGRLVNDGHKFDSFWGHSPMFTVLYSSRPTSTATAKTSLSYQYQNIKTQSRGI